MDQTFQYIDIGIGEVELRAEMLDMPFLFSEDSPSWELVEMARLRNLHLPFDEGLEHNEAWEEYRNANRFALFNMIPMRVDQDGQPLPWFKKYVEISKDNQAAFRYRSEFTARGFYIGGTIDYPADSLEPAALTFTFGTQNKWVSIALSDKDKGGTVTIRFADRDSKDIPMGRPSVINFPATKINSQEVFRSNPKSRKIDAKAIRYLESLGFKLEGANFQDIKFSLEFLIKNLSGYMVDECSDPVEAIRLLS